MNPGIPLKAMRGALLALVFAALGGCTVLVSNAADRFADNLSAAVMNQDDPETARAAIPSYIILIDSLLEGDPDNPAMLASAANLYASYGAVFADNEVRARRLTSRARNYSLRAICLRYEDACDWRNMNYPEFTESLVGFPDKEAELLYTYGFSTLAYFRAHSSDWSTLGDLPQIEALFDHYLAIEDVEITPATHMYMGVLLTLRPPALGGKPDEAREHFEKAIALSNDRDLSAKVEFARGYAKLLYDRELHDQLLNEVIAADPYADGLTLSNVLAQDDAVQLLAEADDYF